MLTALRHRTRDSAGFTLIEMMVAMAAGIVVLFGLSDLMIVTLHQSQRTFTRIDATRQARTALATIENELHSACVGASAPIQGGSTADTLAFVSFYGTAASPTPVWHQLTFDPTAGTLTDMSYAVTGSAPAFLQGAYQSTNTLLTNVTQQAGNTPAFQYYAYAQVDSDASGRTYWVIPDGTNQDPLTGTVVAPAALDTSKGLTSTAAATVVEVVMNLSVGATASNLNAPVTDTASNDPVTDAISLRLTTPPNEVAAGAKATGYGPCQ
jgi:prepilin-type N-terminal cleavage/methylation domain-containing protein